MQRRERHGGGGELLNFRVLRNTGERLIQGRDQHTGGLARLDIWETSLEQLQFCLLLGFGVRLRLLNLQTSNFEDFNENAFNRETHFKKLPFGMVP